MSTELEVAKPVRSEPHNELLLDLHMRIIIVRRRKNLKKKKLVNGCNFRRNMRMRMTVRMYVRVILRMNMTDGYDENEKRGEYEKKNADQAGRTARAKGWMTAK